jgi:hypothetical protein
MFYQDGTKWQKVVLLMRLVKVRQSPTPNWTAAYGGLLEVCLRYHLLVETIVERIVEVVARSVADFEARANIAKNR